jgi:hypothetical protein
MMTVDFDGHAEEINGLWEKNTLDEIGSGDVKTHVARSPEENIYCLIEKDVWHLICNSEAST